MLIEKDNKIHIKIKINIKTNINIKTKDKPRCNKDSHTTRMLTHN